MALTLAEFRRVLQRSLSSSTAKVLLITQGARPALNNDRLKTDFRLPSGLAPISYAVVVFVKPFDIRDATTLESLVSQNGYRTQVVRTAEPLPAVIETIVDQLKADVAVPAAPSSAPGDRLVSMAEMLRTRMPGRALREAPENFLREVVEVPAPLPKAEQRAPKPVPSTPPVEARPVPVPEPEPKPAPTAVPNRKVRAATMALAARLMGLADAVGKIPPLLPLCASVKFNPTDPCWLITAGRARRFTRAYCNPGWTNASAEGKRLAVLAARCGISGTADGFRVTLQTLCAEEKSPPHYPKAEPGSVEIAVLSHVNILRTSDDAEAQRLLAHCLPGVRGVHKRKSIAGALRNLTRLKLIPRPQPAPAETKLGGWIIANLQPDRESNEVEATRLHELAGNAKKHMKRRWTQGSIRQELYLLTTSGRIPPALNSNGQAKKALALRDARIQQLEEVIIRLGGTVPPVDTSVQNGNAKKDTS